MDDHAKKRARILESLGASPRQVEELLEYNRNCFDRSQIRQLTWPMPDEEFVQAWQTYEAAVKEAGTIEAVFPYLVQLRFPVQEGISNTPEYLAATRNGADTASMDCTTGLKLRAPERCRIELHPTAAGRIPLLIAEVREDFEALVQAFTRRNEPVPVPAAMGAVIVSGYNNWHRISQLQRNWAAGSLPGESWHEAFVAMLPQKNLYQDRFIILSTQEYSGVPASAVGLGSDEWKHASLVIRREHECTHYVTRRVFSSMRNNVLDELIADYVGVISALPHFRAAWLLHFLGLESFPAYREGGRLQNYRGEPPLSDGAFAVLQTLTVRAAHNLEQFHQGNSRRASEAQRPIEAILRLSCMTLEELAFDTLQDMPADASTLVPRGLPAGFRNPGRFRAAVEP